MTSTRIATTLMTLALAALLGAGCGKDEDKRIRTARDLAKTFHDAVLRSDVRVMLECVDYPFCLDDRNRIAASEDVLKPLLEKQRLAMYDRVQSANVTEVLTYEEFVGGKSFSGQPLAKEAAAAEAKKVGLRDGGLIVRCYHEDRETKRQDGRCYYLVMHQNSLGELKVTTYWD